MKKWPEGNETVRFDDLVEPVCEAIQFAYNLERKNRNRSIPWTGLDISEDTKVGCPSPPDRLRRDSLRYDEEEQGRDALRVIVGIAIQVGIEQGRRIQWNRLDTELSLLSMQMANCHEIIEGLIRKRDGKKRY